MQTGVFFLGGYHLYLQLFSHYHLLLVYPGWWNMMTCTSWNWGHSTKGRGREELGHGDFVVPFVQKVHQKDLVRLVLFSSSNHLGGLFFSIFFECSPPKLGEDESILTNIFSCCGLKQPTTKTRSVPPTPKVNPRRAARTVDGFRTARGGRSPEKGQACHQGLGSRCWLP